MHRYVHQAARRARQVPAAHAESSPPRARQRLDARARQVHRYAASRARQVPAAHDESSPPRARQRPGTRARQVHRLRTPRRPPSTPSAGSPRRVEPAKGTPSTAANNVTRIAYATSVITPYARVELSGKHSGYESSWCTGLCCPPLHRGTQSSRPGRREAGSGLRSQQQCSLLTDPYSAF